MVNFFDILKRTVRSEMRLTSLENNLSLLQGEVAALIAGGGGSSGTVGVDGSAFVFKNGGGYARDPNTGKYHLIWTYSANGAIPAAPVRGATGYTFAAIPANPVYA